MIGGVSLAIWIGGVTLELQHLDLAGRDPRQTTVPVGVYQELLEFLHARARVDVIAGTSAGGVHRASSEAERIHCHERVFPSPRRTVTFGRDRSPWVILSPIYWDQ
jgi:hypothetical protein